MNPAQWKLAVEIFQAALDEPADKRLSFVHEACTEPELEAQVCRLLAADEKAGSFLERPEMPSDFVQALGSPHKCTLAAGSVLSGRFEIVRLLGQGGMGQVYEAVDLDLRQRIALKTIRPEISSDSHALARFKKEVYLTRRITHPNVCRTFDLDRHSELTPDGTPSDVVFLTMELLAGETLSQLLRRRGKLSVEECFPVVSQLVEALSAAHKAGVIHRDLKPSNILLVPATEKPRVVVTDFGLALGLQPDGNAFGEGPLSSITGSEQMLGTLAYMAPELLESGEATEASDIYSLGLIVFEMVTGKRPFADENSLFEAVKRLKQPAPAPQQLVPELSPTWATVITRCLASNPSNRFGSVEEVLQGISQSGETATTRKRPAYQIWSRDQVSGTAGINRLRWLRIFGILSATVALLWVTFRFYQRKEDSKIGPGASVLLTEIRNNTGDSRFDGTTALVAQQLSQSPYFNVVEKRRVEEILNRMEKPPGSVSEPGVAREVALRSGTPRVVFGAVSRIGDSYVLDVNIEKPDSNPAHARARWENHWTWSGTASGSYAGSTMPTGFLSALRNCSDWVRSEIGESRNDIALLDAPPEDITTDNWEALSEYVKAEQFNASGEHESAVVALENAVKADPRFALAYMRMADHLISLRRFDEGYVAYANAVRDGKEHRLTRRESFRLQGIYASDSGDFASAEEAFHNYTVYYSNDYLGWFYRAYPLMMLGRLEEAIASLKRASDLNPAGMSSPAHLARFNMISGNFDETRTWIGRLRQAGHGEDADIVEGELKLLTNDCGGSESLFGHLRESKNALNQTMSYSFLARVSAECAQYEKAVKYLTEGIAADLSAGDRVHRADKLLDRSYIYLKRGQYAECLRDAKEALNADRSFERSMTAASILGRAASDSKGKLSASIMAELRRTENLLPKVDFAPISEIARARVRGELLLVQGNVEAAVQEFRKAVVLESPVVEHEYLARGLRAAARQRKPNFTATEGLREALAEYAKTTRRPGQVWQWSLDYLPGYLSDETFSHVSVSTELGEEVPEIKNELDFYLARRRNGDGAFTEEGQQLAKSWKQGQVH
jgi:eukaryotic-like serine/threonine-protein kinase